MTLKERIFTITLFIATILDLVSFILWPSVLGGVSCLALSMVCLIVLLEYGKIQ